MCSKREGKVRGACKLQRVKSCKGKFLSNATISLAHTQTHTQLLKAATVSAVCIRMLANQGKARLNVGWLNLHSAFKLTFICHTTNSKLRRSAFTFAFSPAHCVCLCKPRVACKACTNESPDNNNSSSTHTAAMKESSSTTTTTSATTV